MVKARRERTVNLVLIASTRLKGIFTRVLFHWSSSRNAVTSLWSISPRTHPCELIVLGWSSTKHNTVPRFWLIPMGTRMCWEEHPQSGSSLQKLSWGFCGRTLWPRAGSWQNAVSICQRLLSVSLNAAHAFHAFNGFAHQGVNSWINSGFKRHWAPMRTSVGAPAAPSAEASRASKGKCSQDKHWSWKAECNPDYRTSL